MIKIITGWSDKGGSTVVLTSLTNLLNEFGHETIMYGPHEYHLGLCKSGILNEEVFDNITEDDIILSHFLKLDERPKAKKVFLVCHEKWWFDVGRIKQYWDEVVFLHQAHADYHVKYKGKYSIIPNLKFSLSKHEKPELDKVAGVIGSIEDRKQTHVSIQRALKDKCDKIYLFGEVGTVEYYNSHVKPLLTLPKIIEYGHAEDKQSMYDMVGRVYHSSKGEVACLVKDECWSTGTMFFGNEETEHEVSPLSNEDILSLWVKLIK
jgi:hypothetical protein